MCCQTVTVTRATVTIRAVKYLADTHFFGGGEPELSASTLGKGFLFRAEPAPTARTLALASACL